MCSGLLLKMIDPRKALYPLIFVGVMLVNGATGQEFNGGYDSLPFSKPNAREMIYNFPDTLIRQITIHPFIPEHRHLSDKQSRNNLLLGIASLMVLGGLSSESEMDVIWELPCGLLDEYQNPDWVVSLFCLGKLSNVRQQVDNGDGTFSMERTSTAYTYWEKESVGIIHEGNDTIGRFNIIMDPQECQELKPWSDRIYSQPVFPAQTRSKNNNYWHQLNWREIDYAIAGIFRGKNFFIISNGKVRKSWFFIEKDLVCIFRPDIDFNRIKEEDRLTPYILLSNSIPASERPDWYRLALMTCFMTSKLGVASFSY
jgi:hypothetical protein